MKTGIAYFGIRNPEFAEVDLRTIRFLEYTHVLHTVSEEDMQYNQENVKDIIARSTNLGLKVYVSPWGIGRVFSGESYSEITATNPEIAQHSNCDEILPAACPNNPKFREYMLKWIEFVCSCDIETVFWDEPHFFLKEDNPRRWACSCSICKKKFRKVNGHSMPSGITESVKRFRQNSLLEFIDLMMTEVKKYGKRNSLCLMPSRFNDGVDDWEEFAQLESIDELGTDPYWERGEKDTVISHEYHEISSKLLTVCQKYGLEAQILVKNYQIAHNNEDVVAAATWASFNEGVRNIFAWAFKGTSYLSALKCDNPELVWEMQSQCFSECIAKAAQEKAQ